MKPTLRNIEKRLSTLEAAPKLATEEPLTVRIQYIDNLGKEIAPATKWETTRSRNPDTGQEIIVEWPVAETAP